MATSKKAERLTTLAEQLRGCKKCPLHTSRTLAVPGNGTTSARVMLIGEAPGKEEDQQGQPFVGAAGRTLAAMLEANGLNRRDFFITNIVKCRPPHNRNPRKHEIDTCTSHYLFEQIKLVNPKLTVLLGSVAMKTLLKVSSVNEARGRIIEQDNQKYLVGYHPASGFYRQDLAERVREDFAFLADELKHVET